MKDMLLIYNARLVDRDTDIKRGALLIEGNKIAGFPTKSAVKKMLSESAARIARYDAEGRTVMPAFIDTHAHFRDPGQTLKEDMESGCRAAAAGGYGTAVLMPNTNPVISSQRSAQRNNAIARRLGYIDVIQSVSITKDFDGETISHLEALDSKTVPLITEDGKEVTSSAVMLSAMRTAAKKNLIVACHSEDPFLASSARALRTKALKLLRAGKKSEAIKLLRETNSLLALAEDTATERNIRLAEEAGCRLHLCHVSTERCVRAVQESRARGNSMLSFEVTPHHLGLSSAKKENLLHIVNPPLRTERDRTALIQALLDGTATCIGTDHAPHTEQDKKNGAPGFSGMETAFAVCYTTLVKENGMSLKRLSSLLSANAAELLGLKNKGLLKEGFAADITVVSMDEEWTVRGREFASKGKYTPFEGKKLTGKIEATFHNGKIIFQE